MTVLFTPFRLEALTLKNRIAMAPMTRCRAIGNLPNDLMAAYYAQRAGAGLIVSEGTSPSPNGLGYARIPGLFTDEQAVAWSRVTAAVHDAGGRIFVQLMHTGRVGHPLNLPPGARVLSASAVRHTGTMWTDQKGMQPHPTPEAMSDADIAAAVEEYAHAAALARVAGFDGVELHGANGYLIDQFLNTATNRRTDAWGGSPAGRIRFAVDVARAASARIGADRVGLRLSPFGQFNEMQADDEMEATYRLLAAEARRLGLAYLHLNDQFTGGAPAIPASVLRAIRDEFRGPVVLAGNYDLARAQAALREGAADVIAFGRPFIANPDLPRRLRDGVPLAEPNANTFYTPDARGYTDYPAAAAPANA